MRRDRPDLKPITVRRQIDATPEEVWALISAASNLEECHPFCASNPVDAWPGVESRDKIEYYNERVVERHFTAWHDGIGYDLEASDTNGSSASVSWRISDTEGGTALTISLVPRISSKVPAVARWLPYRTVVRLRMRRYLQAVLAGIDWRVTTGKPAQRNQFGAHPWFSPRT